MFPKVPDHHKPGKPQVPTGFGVVYVLVSLVYLFVVGAFGIGGVSEHLSVAFVLASCIMFGGFIGIVDDWMNLKWRYKALMPLIIAVPIIALSMKLGLRTSIDTLVFGTVEFGVLYYLVITPLFVTIATNTVNQLAGLNGLETVPPAIIMAGMMIAAPAYAVLLAGPLAVLCVLAALNFRGKIFVGNVGSFAIGLTLASFAMLMDIKVFLIIALAPYVINSVLILFAYFFTRKKAALVFDGSHLTSDHRRSLLTLIVYRRRVTERSAVIAVSLVVAASTIIAVVASMLL